MAGAHHPDATAIPLGRPSPGASSNQPERQGQRTRPSGAVRRRAWLLFGFAPGGACHAADVAARAVRSYRTLSPLPDAWPCSPRSGGLLSVALSLGSPPPDVIRRRIRMEPGLSSACDSGGRPADWLAEGIGGRSGGGQAESDAAERAGRGNRCRTSFIVASIELWDCGDELRQA